jgi:hypothetical protein
MPCDPVSPYRKLRERHACLKRNACFLGQDCNRAKRSKFREKGVEDGSDLGRLALEVPLQVLKATTMLLISIREVAPAHLTAPWLALHITV